MLSKYDAKLTELREKMARRSETQSRKTDLEKQKEKLSAQEQQLYTERQYRQAEVERLSRGMMSVWYLLIGKKAELLNAAQERLNSASAEYEEAAKQLRQTEEQLESLSWDLSDMANAEARYRETIEEKLSVMRANGIEAEMIRSIDEKLHLMGDRLREVEQAYSAGRRVIGQLENIETELAEAERYGRIDLYGLNKSSMFSQLGKYVHFDNAQSHAKNLQRFVDEFQKELTDISVAAEIYVNISSFMRFADWFFDGILVDLAALRRIEESQSGVRAVRVRIERILERLNEMKNELVQQAAALQRDLYALAENTQ